MTVNYNKEIATSNRLTFLKLLFRWKASIWKAVYMELITYLIVFGIISVIYRTALSTSQQNTFEKVIRYFDARMGYIPLELVLGFFSTQVINRWNKLYLSIGFIDNLSLMIALYVRGKTERARRYRRNILRYCALVQVLVFRDISMRTRRRFPTMDTVVVAGFMLPHEKAVFEEYNDKENTPKYWIPANWALSMTYKAWKDGHIESDYYKVALQKEIRTWRTNMEWLFNYDWVPFPLMYPQVVCLAVHLHFLVSIISRQYVITQHETKNEIDAYFPIMTVLQFVCYMGWMKVIEVLLNPFGEDDDDFETNALIDRNIKMGMIIVDEGFNRPPELKKDPFWDEVQPLYSEESSRLRNNMQRGSVSQVKLASSVREVVMMPHNREHEHGNHDPEHLNAIRSTVTVKDEERYVPSRRKSSIFSKIGDSFEKMWLRVWSFLKSLISTNKKDADSTRKPTEASNFSRSYKPAEIIITPPEYAEKEVV